MDIEIKILLFLIMLSLVSTLESRILKRKNIFLIFAFYLAMNFFVMSAVKYYLGYSESNLSESFWDTQFITFIHYGIPMFVINIAVPIILKVLFKENDIEIIRYFLSAYCMTFSLCFLLIPKITNKVVCVTFCIALVIVLCSMGSIFKRNCKYIIKNNLKEHMIFMIPFLLLYLVTVVIYSPSELYLKNAADFPMPFWYFFGNLLLVGIVVCMVLAVCMILFMTKEHFEWFMTILFALIAVGYIQGLFLNGNMKVLDGTRENEYLDDKAIVNIIIWGLITGIIILFFVMKRHTTQKIMKVISVYIILIQGVSLIVLMLSSDKSVFVNDEYVLTTDGMLEVATDENVIVLVLDKFDGRYMDLVLEDDPDFLEPLNDFTYYKNASSEFPGTFTGIPYLLTGTPFDEESDLTYVTYAYEDKNLLTELNEAGYELGIYTNNQLVSETMKDIIQNYKNGISIKCDIKAMFSLMTRASKYKMSPFAAKKYYLYDTSDVGLLVDDDRIVNILCDIPLYKNLIKTRLSVSSKGGSKSFIFIHMYGAHPPYTMTENFQRLSYDVDRDDDEEMALSQMRGSLKIVYEYVKQLKEIGKYDSSLIFITADHGAVMRDESGEETPVEYPILLVKEPYEKNDKLIYNMAPVCHDDIIATIRNFTGINKFAKTISEYENNEKRTRYFYATSGAKPFSKYQINGDVASKESWELMYSK